MLLVARALVFGRLVVAASLGRWWAAFVDSSQLYLRVQLGDGLQGVPVDHFETVSLSCTSTVWLSVADYKTTVDYNILAADRA